MPLGAEKIQKSAAKFIAFHSGHLSLVTCHLILLGLGLRRDPPRLGKQKPASEPNDQKGACHLGGPKGAKPKGVSPHKLTGETDKTIKDEINSREEPWPRRNFGKPPKGQKDEEIPHGLVEHGGMEGLPGIGRAGRRIQRKNHTPGKGSGCPECIPIQKISDSAENLPQRHRGDGDIRETPKPDFLPLCGDEKAQNPTQKPAVDGQASMPHRGDLPRYPAVKLPIKCHVVEPREKDPQGNGDEENVQNILAPKRKAFPFAHRPHDEVPHDEGDDVHETVIPDFKGPDT